MTHNTNQEVRSKHIIGRCADYFHLVLEMLMLLDHGKVEPPPVRIINNLLVTIKLLNYKQFLTTEANVLSAWQSVVNPHYKHFLYM